MSGIFALCIAPLPTVLTGGGVVEKEIRKNRQAGSVSIRPDKECS